MKQPIFFGSLHIDFCSGKADGFYSNQLTCDAYYVCRNGITSPMFCDHGLHWDQTNKVCNHPDNAGCTVNEQSDDTRSGYTSGQFTIFFMNIIPVYVL